MAFITLSGTLLDPNGDLAVGDQIRFTHKSTTGETVESAVSLITVDPAGAYSLPLQYGLVLVEYKDVRTQQFKNLGVATVNGANPATSIPELLNALVPVSSAELIEFQAILANCVAAQTAAENAATTAEAFAYQLTTTDLIASTATFAAETTIPTSGFFTSGDSGNGSWKHNGITGRTPSQSPAQLGDALLNDGNGNQWALVFGKTVILEKLGGVSALQAALNTRAPEVVWFTESLNLDAVRYTIYSGQHLHGPGIEKSTLNISAGLSTTLAQFENEHADFALDGIRRDKNIKFSGFTIDCSARVYASWLSNAAGTPIANPEFDYSPAGIIGLGGTINDVVAADRRNANYADIGQVIRMIKVEFPVVENVRITGHESLSVTDEGCLSMRVRNCHFDNQGKIDNIASAIWAQSFGSPTSPPAGYQDSEDHVTEYCTFSCKRSAITLQPTKGGAFRFNTVYNSGESTVFSGSQANFNGGRIDVHGNTFGPTVLTDIVATHVENNGNDNYHIYDNECEKSDFESINTAGGSTVGIHGNTFTECVQKSVTTYPYGPFSERYAFDIGSTPIAGDTVPDRGIIVTGTLNTIGANGQVINNNWFIDERVTSLASGIIELSKQGADSVSDNISIIDNDRTKFTDTAVPLIFKPVVNVMNSRMALTAKGNKNDSSETGKRSDLQVAIADTGTKTIDVGFRPSKVRVYAAQNSGANGSSWSGDFFWEALPNGGVATRNDAGVNNNNNNWATVLDQDVYRLVDGAGTLICNAEFTSWDETGFTINVINAAQIANIRFFCEA